LLTTLTAGLGNDCSAFGTTFTRSIQY
jgi:hypothetical protein